MDHKDPKHTKQTKRDVIGFSFVPFESLWPNLWGDFATNMEHKDAKPNGNSA